MGLNLTSVTGARLLYTSWTTNLCRASLSQYVITPSLPPLAKVLKLWKCRAFTLKISLPSLCVYSGNEK